MQKYHPFLLRVRAGRATGEASISNSCNDVFVNKKCGNKQHTHRGTYLNQVFLKRFSHPFTCTYEKHFMRTTAFVYTYAHVTAISHKRFFYLTGFNTYLIITKKMQYTSFMFYGSLTCLISR